MPPAISSAPWVSTHPTASNHQLIQIPAGLLEGLSSNRPLSYLVSSLLPYEITPYLHTRQPLWLYRRTQLQKSPEDAPWITRLVLYTDPQSAPMIVGVAGYHGAPDDRGMVEVGYSIDPLHRRKGHARAALRILLDAARENGGVAVVRASIGPWNEASRKLAEEFWFQEVGTQWDEEDGEEIVFEVDVK